MLLGFGSVTVLRAQSDISDNSSGKPYATLNRHGVAYRGPRGATNEELPDDAAVIGLMLPFEGPQKAEGAALLAAMQSALAEEQARGPLPDGRKLMLLARDESGPWGQASSEILKLIEQDHALVVLTSANGSIAHQAEQLANKISFPILTLASDPSTTQTNVPWILRLVPSDREQARAFGQAIFQERKLQHVLLVTQADHDGRIGRSEFQKMAREMSAAHLDELELSGGPASLDALRERIEHEASEAVVVWTDAAQAQEVVSVVRKMQPAIPIFLCTKSSQFRPADGTHIFTVASSRWQGVSIVDLQGTGADSGFAAFQAAEAVHLIAAGLRATGSNRVLLRDYFAGEKHQNERASALNFDAAGNCLDEFAVVELRGPSTQSENR